MAQAVTKFFNDARHFQITYLGSFLLLSFWLLERDDFLRCGLVITTTLLLQYIGNHIIGKPEIGIKSALITALGLCLLLKTNHWETAMLASAIAIASKFIIRFKGKHIFNPVNAGIVLGVIFSQDAWISPGQWGSGAILLFALGVLGFFVLNRVNRIDIALTFLATYGGLLFLKSIVFLGWPVDFFFHQITNGTLMLFTFFMITDPMTTPNHRKGRILFAIAIAVFSFLLSSEWYFYSAPIYVLFGMSLLIPFMDKIWKANPFQWKTSKLKNFKPVKSLNQIQ